MDIYNAMRLSDGTRLTVSIEPARDILARMVKTALTAQRKPIIQCVCCDRAPAGDPSYVVTVVGGGSAFAMYLCAACGEGKTLDDVARLVDTVLLRREMAISIDLSSKESFVVRK